MGRPHKKIPLKGRGMWSQLDAINADLAERAKGIIGAPERRDASTIPLPALILGPCGPSGVIPTTSPRLIVRMTFLRAELPPFVEDPGNVLIPKGATALEINNPSRCSEIIILTGFSNRHA